MSNYSRLFVNLLLRLSYSIVHAMTVIAHAILLFEAAIVSLPCSKDCGWGMPSWSYYSTSGLVNLVLILEMFAIYRYSNCESLDRASQNLWWRNLGKYWKFNSLNLHIYHFIFYIVLETCSLRCKKYEWILLCFHYYLLYAVIDQQCY